MQYPYINMVHFNSNGRLLHFVNASKESDQKILLISIMTTETNSSIYHIHIKKLDAETLTARGY